VRENARLDLDQENGRLDETVDREAVPSGIREALLSKAFLEGLPDITLERADLRAAARVLDHPDAALLVDAETMGLLVARIRLLVPCRLLGWRNGGCLPAPCRPARLRADPDEPRRLGNDLSRRWPEVGNHEPSTL
jgi:hypothetical protein